jgi:hypothetical protein
VDAVLIVKPWSMRYQDRVSLGFERHDFIRYRVNYNIVRALEMGGRSGCMHCHGAR